MNNDVTIRRMTIDDVDGVYAVEKDTFTKPWRREDFVREMTANACARYLTAVVDGKIIGFAGAWVVFDEAHITNIAVQKEYRGRGIGRALTRGIMRYAANLGARVMTLEVRQSNAIAQALYHSLGFHTASVRKKYYEDNGEDALLMVCAGMPDADDDFEEEETVRE